MNAYLGAWVGGFARIPFLCNMWMTPEELIRVKRFKRHFKTHIRLIRLEWDEQEIETSSQRKT